MTGDALIEAGNGVAEAVGWLLVCLTNPTANGYDGATSRTMARQRVAAWEAAVAAHIGRRPESSGGDAQ